MTSTTPRWVYEIVRSPEGGFEGHLFDRGRVVNVRHARTRRGCRRLLREHYRAVSDGQTVEIGHFP